MPTEYRFEEVWKVQADGARGQMMARDLIPDICDLNDGQPVLQVGRPPAHPNCYCETRIVLEVVGEV